MIKYDDKNSHSVDDKIDFGVSVDGVKLLVEFLQCLDVLGMHQVDLIPGGTLHSGHCNWRPHHNIDWLSVGQEAETAKTNGVFTNSIF